MLSKVKKYSIIIIIAILFTLFCFSVVDVIVEEPDYNDFCEPKYGYVRPLAEKLNCSYAKEPSEAEMEDCRKRGGEISYNYNEEGCPVTYECETCHKEHEEAGRQYRLIGFIVTSIMGVLAIIIGMYATSKKDVIEWLFSGLLIGGILSVFFGTVSYFRDMGRYVKPFVLLGEIVLIIWIAVKTSRKK
ncbi:hypothetical protein JXB41_08045 [Candidatus Woesearchaeota archaeon]|nr:hypothetical protein [Candidatus Woesearchaeota archaeon]